MPDHSIEIDVLDRVLAGEASEAERVRVARWLEATPEARAICAALRESDVRDPDVDDGWNRLQSGLADGRVRRLRIHPRFPAAWAVRVAALFVVALAVGLIWRGRMTTRAPIVSEAPRGQRVSVTLADGSHVLLAPGTRLMRPNRFGRTRTVELQGEAFFQIAHDARHPFRVLASGTETRVLGTEFSVRAWPGDDTVHVVVQSGRVSVTGQGATANLTAGGMAAIAAGRIVTGRVEVESALAWTRGRIVLENARFDESIPVLERWLNIEIVLADASSGKRRITASLPGDSTLAAVEAIGLALGLEVQLNGRVVTIGKPSP